MPDELVRRLKERRHKIEYLAILSNDDVTKYEQIRHTNYIDCMEHLSKILSR